MGKLAGISGHSQFLTQKDIVLGKASFLIFMSVVFLIFILKLHSHGLIVKYTPISDILGAIQ